MDATPPPMIEPATWSQSAPASQAPFAPPPITLAQASLGGDNAFVGRTIEVRDGSTFRKALSSARAGTTILMRSGNYPGATIAYRLEGSIEHPIVIAAADPEHPPIILGGPDGLKLSSPRHVELRNLIFEGQSGNGINIDDDDKYPARAATNITLDGITVRNMQSRGNSDGIKLSGVDLFFVRNCRVLSWGDGGSAIDMVGCHDGVIEGCTFSNRGGANGVEAKGGSRNIEIVNCRFESAGARAVQIGGNTTPGFFRPLKAPYEVKDVMVQRCVFVGGEAPIAFASADGGTFRFNTVYRPTRYAVRILQENNNEGMPKCRNGEITDNIFVFHKGDFPGETINIGPNTEPKTFRFARNWWYCADEPALSRRPLPSTEEDPTHGKDPQLQEPPADLRTRPDSPAAKVGAHAKP